MKTISFDHVDLTGGYLFEKQELNRKITINAVYDRFYETGRMTAFDFAWKEGDPQKPHFFWDSDVAKWMEGVAYILRKHDAPDLEQKVDALVEKIQQHQGEDGYFNIYFTVVEPDARFTNRDRHELYCAGHLIEAAVAYAETTGKTQFLSCMEKYADYIYRVFVEEQSTAFQTPGHEEIELALVRLYRHTGKKKYLDLAAYFINTRGTVEEQLALPYHQSHLPVREQTEVVGHAVRAMYLYIGMAYLAAETGELALTNACKVLWNDAVRYKMYVTGGLGSTPIGEAFTNRFDLPNDTAYAETCAAIGLIFFSDAMLALENDAKYADVLERALYNGMLSGLSQDGKKFFYVNPLEITLNEHFDEDRFGKRKLPITQRVEYFGCSCCPPNLNRVLPSLGKYLYGEDGDTLYINQFVSSNLKTDSITCTQVTDYPRTGSIAVTVTGAKRVALRIPGWCENFTLNKPYKMEKGYAVVENDGSEICLELVMTTHSIWADPRVVRNAGRLCFMRGPIVYCAEGVDNGVNLHRFVIPQNFSAKEVNSEEFGLPNLEISCYERLPLEDALYAHQPPKKQPAVLKLIPYNAFANRGESDMLVWFCAE